MSPELPPEGAVLVVTDAPGEWGAVVADRNAAGKRTALLVAGALDDDLQRLAEAMAAEVFAGAPCRLVNAR